MQNLNAQVYKYSGPYTPDRYNQFFNPNVCHVCKTRHDSLILCDWCSMISYCSVEHKTEHQPQHLEICKEIAKHLKVIPPKDKCRFISWSQWFQSRNELLKLTRRAFDRPLEPYVKQMILWPKSCFVCYQQAELRVCRKCFSANYCDEHEKTFRIQHSQYKCNLLITSLNIDIEAISGEIADMSYEFLASIDETKLLSNMTDMFYYMLSDRKDRRLFTKDYVQSSYLSRPLSVYSGFKKLRALNILQQPHVVIHVIAANSVDQNSLPAWEILLHLLPNMKNLVIIMIGSELEYSSCVHNLCGRCKNRNATLTSYSNPMLYYQYIELPHNYTHPTMIVGFHVEFNEEDTWGKSIIAMQTRGCPLLLSSSCEQEAQIYITKIKKDLDNVNIEPFFIRTNGFNSFVPHRVLLTGDTHFCNDFLIIYRDLYYFDTYSFDDYDDNPVTVATCSVS